MRRHLHSIILIFILIIAVLMGCVDNGASMLASENKNLESELARTQRELDSVQSQLELAHQEIEEAQSRNEERMEDELSQAQSEVERLTDELIPSGRQVGVGNNSTINGGVLNDGVWADKRVSGYDHMTGRQTVLADNFSAGNGIANPGNLADNKTVGRTAANRSAIRGGATSNGSVITSGYGSGTSGRIGNTAGINGAIQRGRTTAGSTTASGGRLGGTFTGDYAVGGATAAPYVGIDYETNAAGINTGMGNMASGF